MRTTVVFLLLALVLPAQAGRVVEAQPHRADGWLRVDLWTADLLDPRTRSTVESGLPGSCHVRLELRTDDGEVVVRRAIERVLEFDLWEGVARVRGGGLDAAFSTLAAADSAWARFASIPLLPWSRVDADRRHRLFVHVEVESFGTEEAERVSRYVSESERGDRTELSFDLGGLVRRFVGAGDDEGDVWRSESFVPRALPHRPPDASDGTTDDDRDGGSMP